MQSNYIMILLRVGYIESPQFKKGSRVLPKGKTNFTPRFILITLIDNYASFMMIHNIFIVIFKVFLKKK